VALKAIGMTPWRNLRKGNKVAWAADQGVMAKKAGGIRINPSSAQPGDVVIYLQGNPCYGRRKYGHIGVLRTHKGELKLLSNLTYKKEKQGKIRNSNPCLLANPSTVEVWRLP